jgi:hypothetical protein
MKMILLRYLSCVNFGTMFCLFSLFGCNENKGIDVAPNQNTQPNSVQAERLNCDVLNPTISFLDLPLHVTVNDWNKSMALAAKSGKIMSLKMDHDLTTRNCYNSIEKYGALIGFLDSGCSIYPMFLKPDVTKCYLSGGKRIDGVVVSSIEIEPRTCKTSLSDTKSRIDEIILPLKYRNISGANHRLFSGRAIDEFGRNPYIEQAILNGSFTEEEIRGLRAKEPDPTLPDNKTKTEELTDEFLYEFENGYILIEIVSKCAFVSLNGIYVSRSSVYYDWKIKFLSKQLSGIRTENYLDNEQRAIGEKLKNDSITEQYIRQYGN